MYKMATKTINTIKVTKILFLVVVAHRKEDIRIINKMVITILIRIQTTDTLIIVYTIVMPPMILFMITTMVLLTTTIKCLITGISQHILLTILFMIKIMVLLITIKYLITGISQQAMHQVLYIKDSKIKHKHIKDQLMVVLINPTKILTTRTKKAKIYDEMQTNQNFSSINSFQIDHLCLKQIRTKSKPNKNKI